MMDWYEIDKVRSCSTLRRDDIIAFYDRHYPSELCNRIRKLEKKAFWAVVVKEIVRDDNFPADVKDRAVFLAKEHDINLL